MNIQSRVNISELDGPVLCIGRFVYIKDMLFFTNAYYTEEGSDYMPIEPFEGISDLIASPVVVLLGRFIIENNNVKNFPIGVLKLL